VERKATPSVGTFNLAATPVPIHLYKY